MNGPQDAAGLQQACLRLERSRRKLLEQMRQAQPAGGKEPPAGNTRSPPGSGRLWRLLMQVWGRHPVVMAAQGVAPWIVASARRHPWPTVLLSGLLGALLMGLRPWRVLPMGAMLLTALRALPLSALLAAWRAQAQPPDQTAEPGEGPAS